MTAPQDEAVQPAARVGALETVIGALGAGRSLLLGLLHAADTGSTPTPAAPELPDRAALAAGLTLEARDHLVRATRHLGAAATTSARTVLSAGDRVLGLPGLDALRDPLQRGVAALHEEGQRIAGRGRDAGNAGRRRATALAGAGFEMALAWAVDEVVPPLVDRMLKNPEFRTFVVEQGQGVMHETAEGLRGRAALADDRVEERFRRLFRRGAPKEPGAPAPQPTPNGEGV